MHTKLPACVCVCADWQLSQAEQDFLTKTAFTDPDTVRGEYMRARPWRWEVGAERRSLGLLLEVASQANDLVPAILVPGVHRDDLQRHFNSVQLCSVAHRCCC